MTSMVHVQWHSSPDRTWKLWRKNYTTGTEEERLNLCSFSDKENQLMGERTEVLLPLITEISHEPSTIPAPVLVPCLLALQQQVTGSHEKWKREIRVWAWIKEKKRMTDRDRLSPAWCTLLGKTPSLLLSYSWPHMVFGLFHSPVLPHSLSFLASASTKTNTHTIKWGMHTYTQFLSHTHTHRHTQWETVAESACDLDWCD